MSGQSTRYKLIVKETSNGYDFIHIPEKYFKESVAWIDVDVFEKVIGLVSVQLLGSHELLKSTDDINYKGSLEGVKLGRLYITHAVRQSDGRLEESSEWKAVTSNIFVNCFIRSLGHTEPVTRIVGWKKVTRSYSLSPYKTNLRNKWNEFNVPDNIQDNVLNMDSLTIWKNLKELLSEGINQNDQSQIDLYNALQEAYYFCNEKGFYKPYSVPETIITEGYNIKDYDISVYVNGKEKEIYRAGRVSCRNASRKTTYRYYFKVIPEEYVKI